MATLLISVSTDSSLGMDTVSKSVSDKFSIRGNNNYVISFEQNLDYTVVGYLSELFYAIVSRQELKVHYCIFKGVDYY